MLGQNLTRLEAQERARIVHQVDSYAVDLDLTNAPNPEVASFPSTTVVRFTATPGGNTFIDLVDAQVHSITLNGAPLDPETSYSDDRIALTGLAAQNVLTIVADCRYTNTGEGLHRFFDPVDSQAYLYSQCEVADARRIFANFEQPDLKAAFQLTVTAPAHWQVISNQEAEVPVPVAGPGGDATLATWTFKPTNRISTYLVALVAGPYSVVRSELTSTDGRKIPLGVFCRESLREYLDAEYILNITRHGFAFFEKAFDFPYPFEKYDQLFVPEFNAGAMENPGCVTFTEHYIFRGPVPANRKERRVVTILHELAHMWFGNLVTMKWWNDLWLNESFAEFVSTLCTAKATEWTNAWVTFNSAEKAWAYRQDALPSTHPIVAEIRDLEDVYLNFDGITYAKGAAVLKQLYVWVGREKFLAGLAQYFRKHAWGSTELRDLLVELEATSGRDLAAWSQTWLETAGTNTLSLDLATDDAGVIRSFDLLQTAPSDHPTLRPHRVGIGFFNLVAAERSTGLPERVERVKHVTVEIAGERTSIPELIGEQRPGLILLNDDDLAFVKIRLDIESRKFAQEHLGQIGDALARALIWAAAWDTVQDGETPAIDYVRLALRNLLDESESAAIQEVLTNLRTAATLYADPAERALLTEAVGTDLWHLAQEASPGSDLQLQLMRAFAGSVTVPSHIPALQGLLDGSQTLPGLTIDTDLRWDLLQGLAVLGAAGEPEIAATLAADDTASGRQAAARVRASLPTTADKEAAFASVVDQHDVPNAIIRATVAGFNRVADPSVLAPLVDRYLDSVLPIWQTRTFQISEELIRGLFPMRLASAELRDAVQTWLGAHPDLAPSLRRLVAEPLSDVERALRAQEVSRRHNSGVQHRH